MTEATLTPFLPDPAKATGAAVKPAFIGDIYGPLEAVTVPADAPPLFAALV